MRGLDTLPAWAARQRSRLLGRHGNQKVVRWINHRPIAKASPDTAYREGTVAEGSDGSAASRNDNLLNFAKAIGGKA